MYFINIVYFSSNYVFLQLPVELYEIRTTPCRSRNSFKYILFVADLRVWQRRILHLLIVRCVPTTPEDVHCWYVTLYACWPRYEASMTVYRRPAVARFTRVACVTMRQRTTKWIVSKWQLSSAEIVMSYKR